MSGLMQRVASHEEDSGEESSSPLECKIQSILTHVEECLNLNAKVLKEPNTALDDLSTCSESHLTLEEGVKKVVALVNEFLERKESKESTPVYPLGPYKITRQARANWTRSLSSNKMKDYHPGKVVHITAVTSEEVWREPTRIRGKVQEGGWISMAIPGTDCKWVEPLFECKGEDVIVFEEQFPSFSLGYYTIVRRARANVDCSLDSEAVQHFNAGDIVKVTEIDSTSCLNRVRAKLQIGAWITLYNAQFNTKFVAHHPPVFQEYNLSKYAVTNRTACVRADASLSSPVVTTLQEGTVVFVLKMKEIFFNNKKKFRALIQMSAVDDFKLGWCTDFVLDTLVSQSECEYLFHIPVEKYEAHEYIAQHEKEVYESYFDNDFYACAKYDDVYCAKVETSIQRNFNSEFKGKQTQKENRTWRHYFTKSHDNSRNKWHGRQEYWRTNYSPAHDESFNLQPKVEYTSSIYCYALQLENSIREKRPMSYDERRNWVRQVLMCVQYDLKNGIPAADSMRPITDIRNTLPTNGLALSGHREMIHKCVVDYLKNFPKEFDQATASDNKWRKNDVLHTVCSNVRTYVRMLNISCAVCCDDDMCTDLHTTGCWGAECYICGDCVNTWLRMSGEAGKSVLRCPGVGCNSPGDFQYALEETFPEAWKSYKNGLWKGELRKCKDFRFCPKDGCGCGFKLPVRCCALKKVTCPECDYNFCPQCYGPDHSEIGTCHEYLTLTAGFGGVVEITKENTKQCPFCLVWIEKNDGCSHMTCDHCGGEFCWLCMGDWKLHRYKPCPKLTSFAVERPLFDEILPTKPIGIHKILRWAIIRLQSKKTSFRSNMLKPDTYVEVLAFRGNRAKIKYNSGAIGWCSVNTENGRLLKYCEDQNQAELKFKSEKHQSTYEKDVHDAEEEGMPYADQRFRDIRRQFVMDNTDRRNRLDDWDDDSDDEDFHGYLPLSEVCSPEEKPLQTQDYEEYYIDVELKEFNRLKKVCRRSNRLEFTFQSTPGDKKAKEQKVNHFRKKNCKSTSAVTTSKTLTRFNKTKKIVEVENLEAELNRVMFVYV